MKSTLNTFIAIALGLASVCAAQVTIPEGTRIRIRLDQQLSSATARTGQTVEFRVSDPIRINESTVIVEGASVIGHLTEAVPKRRLGRVGSLKFSIERVTTVDGKWVPLRYINTTSKTKGEGQSPVAKLAPTVAKLAPSAMAPMALPVVALGLFAKGKDAVIEKGTTYEVFTDEPYTVERSAPAPRPSSSVAAAPARIPEAAGSATVSVQTRVAGADIEVDGNFVGNTPAKLQLAAGQHNIVVRQGGASWQRLMQVAAGSEITLQPSFAARRRPPHAPAAHPAPAAG